MLVRHLAATGAQVEGGEKEGFLCVCVYVHAFLHSSGKEFNFSLIWILLAKE